MPQWEAVKWTQRDDGFAHKAWNGSIWAMFFITNHSQRTSGKSISKTGWRHQVSCCSYCGNSRSPFYRIPVSQLPAKPPRPPEEPTTATCRSEKGTCHRPLFVPGVTQREIDTFDKFLLLIAKYDELKLCSGCNVAGNAPYKSLYDIIYAETEQ